MISPFDPLFFDPFLTGCAFGIVLPLLGVYLRLRGEWLAALAFAQISAPGALLAALLGAPSIAGGIAAAVLAVVFKQTFEGAARKARGTIYAILFLSGWSVSVLLVVNLPVAERMGHALFDGQLYFTGRAHLVNAFILTAVVFVFLRFVSKNLLLSHFFPDFFRARGLSERRAHCAFDLAVAIALALATASIGVMAAFALVFIPPLIAFKWGANWRRSTVIAVVSGGFAHVAAFLLAIALDQPYGPLLTLLLIIMGGTSQIVRVESPS
ncbi:MAG: metal ABC transporter permease [Candidatus Accumulibacter sp.]|jgi:zinc transport system permease protein|nr:metal ABC transporter permease [Accumulibacter sp.]